MFKRFGVPCKLNLIDKCPMCGNVSELIKYTSFSGDEKLLCRGCIKSCKQLLNDTGSSKK